MKIGLLGGTGIEGKGLALRFAAAGASVVIGSRSEKRALSAAQQYNAILGNPIIQGDSNQTMIARSEIVFLTVASGQVLSAVESVDFSEGQTIVDVTVPMKVRKTGVDYSEPPHGSNLEMIASSVPKEAHLVGAFKTIPAHILAELSTRLDCDVFICGDSQEAKDRVAVAAALIPSLRPLDAGPLKAARILERMTVLAVHMNRLHRSKGARFKISGI
jgi:NADPH-dependent F420 reductase